MRKLAALLLLALLPAAASAETEAGGDDPFARYLFPPDKIMSHSIEIGLEDAQRTAIRNEVQKAQPKFTDAQFELQAEAEKMVRLLQEKHRRRDEGARGSRPDPRRREGDQESSDHASRPDQERPDARPAGQARRDLERLRKVTRAAQPTRSASQPTACSSAQ